MIFPHDSDADRGGLRVVDVQHRYPDDFAPGDEYTTVIALNRPLDAYEKRVLEDELEAPTGFRVGYDSLETRAGVDSVNPDRVLGFLGKLSERAQERREVARTEMRRLGAMGGDLKSRLTSRD